MTMEAFNGLPASEAEEGLLACCAVPAWAARELAALSWAEVEAAVRAHPRIGERAATGGREARWSAREQAGAGDADLTAVNTAYEEKFGHVLLIRATGRTGGELLQAGLDRLGNDPETERAVVRRELGEIVALRVRRLVQA